MRIKKGDSVIVIAGKDKGRTGKVLEAFPSDERVLVEGVNVRKRHQRPTRQNQHGQIIDKALPIHVSNVALLDPKSEKPTRVGYNVEGGKKVRVARKSGSVIA